MTETATPSADPNLPPAMATVSAMPYSASYTRYAMLLLMAIYTINFLDRSVINILAEPIKNELKLADWQLGMMSGLAFALFYTILGIPLAQLAERRNRPMIIGASVAVWSGFTALSGATTNFVQLVLCRIGVGIGEAGCTPPAHSLIADYVPKEKRASALAFYSMGTPLGGLLGLVMGGLIADAYGWRVAFLVAGVPGLFFAALCFLTLREPRKILAEHSAKITSSQATFRETLAYLMKKKTFWLIALGAAIKAFIGYGHAPFTASFFLRVHGDEVARLASMFDLKSIGFNEAIDYRAAGDLRGLTKALQQAAPNGVDVYFDNVGGDHLTAAIACANMYARMPICGMISLYNATGPVPGPNNMTNLIGRRIKLQGFIVSDYAATYSEFVQEMAGWISSGSIKYEETVMTGIEKAPEAFLALFSGGNTGKMLVKLG